MAENDIPECAEPFWKMTADVEWACTFFGTVRSLTGWLIEDSFDDTHKPGDSSAPCMRRDALWRAHAARLLNQTRAPDTLSLTAAVQTAFGDPDGLVRGIAWRLLVEACANNNVKEIVSSIVADDFMKRLPASTDQPERERLAKSFLVALYGMTAVLEGRAFYRGLNEAYIESHAGADAGLIRSSLSSAVDFLEHYDSGRRLAALRVVASAGRAAVVHSAVIAQMILADPDPEVRLAAIVAYMDVHKGTANPECLRLLANIVLDDSRPMRHRFAAYNGLYQVCDEPFMKRPIRAASKQTLDALRDGAADVEWPVEVDWSFIERCRRAM